MASLPLTPVLGKDLMEPTPVLASSIVLCFVPAGPDNSAEVLLRTLERKESSEACRVMQEGKGPFLVLLLGFWLLSDLHKSVVHLGNRVGRHCVGARAGHQQLQSTHSVLNERCLSCYGNGTVAWLTVWQAFKGQ